MKTISILLVVSFLYFDSSIPAHQDTILQVDKNGNIIGLPKEFSPAKA